MKVIRARNRAVAVGERRIPEVEVSLWHLIDQRRKETREKKEVWKVAGWEDGHATVERGVHWEEREQV